MRVVDDTVQPNRAAITELRLIIEHYNDIALHTGTVLLVSDTIETPLRLRAALRKHGRSLFYCVAPVGSAIHRPEEDAVAVIFRHGGEVLLGWQKPAMLERTCNCTVLNPSRRWEEAAGGHRPSYGELSHAVPDARAQATLAVAQKARAGGGGDVAVVVAVAALILREREEKLRERLGPRSCNPLEIAEHELRARLAPVLQVTPQELTKLLRQAHKYLVFDLYNNVKFTDRGRQLQRDGL